MDVSIYIYIDIDIEGPGHRVQGSAGTKVIRRIGTIKTISPHASLTISKLHPQNSKHPE